MALKMILNGEKTSGGGGGGASNQVIAKSVVLDHIDEATEEEQVLGYSYRIYGSMATHGVDDTYSPDVYFSEEQITDYKFANFAKMENGNLVIYCDRFIENIPIPLIIPLVIFTKADTNTGKTNAEGFHLKFLGKSLDNSQNQTYDTTNVNKVMCASSFMRSSANSSRVIQGLKEDGTWNNIVDISGYGNKFVTIDTTDYIAIRDTAVYNQPIEKTIFVDDGFGEATINKSTSEIDVKDVLVMHFLAIMRDCSTGSNVIQGFRNGQWETIISHPNNSEHNCNSDVIDVSDFEKVKWSSSSSNGYMIFGCSKLVWKE